MLDRLALDISSSNKSGASWKTVTKGKRSKKSVAKKFNAITKIGDKSPKRVADFMVSDYDKFDGSVTGKIISNEAEHIPPKKRHTLQSSSAQHEDESLFPQPLTPSPHGDSKLQSKGVSGSLALNFRDRVVGVNDTAFFDAVDKKLYNPNDFSGIALLAAAACIEEMDDEAGTSQVTELSVPTIPVSSEPIKCSVYMEQPNSPQGDRKCSSLDNCVAPPQSLQENEDVAMKELEASKVDRLSWDLNVVMDSWQEPLDCMEDERLEEEGCKLSMKSLNDSSTANLSSVNKSKQSELVCDFDSISVPEEQTSLVDEHCVSKVGEEVRATLPVPSRKDVGSPTDILTSGSTKIGSSLDDCQNVNVSQDNHCNTVISKDMTGFQDGNDSSYEDGELRILMPCLWEENEMDDGDSECFDYESEGSGVEFDDADYPGSEVVAAASEGSLGIEKKNLSFSDANQSESLKSSTEIRYMKEKSDIGGIESTSRSFNNREHYDNMRRRHSGRNYEEINPTYKRKLQSYGEDYFQLSNRSCTYSRPFSDTIPPKFMSRHKSPYHERENRGSRGQLAAGRQGPRNWIGDSSVKMSGSNSQDHRQFLYLSKTHRVENTRSENVRDDYCSGNRRGRGSSGNYPQAVGRGFRDECYNPSHDDHPSSRTPRYLNGHEPRFSPSSSGRFAQNSVPPRRSRSRSPHPLHLQGGRNQVGGRRYTRSPDFRSGARVRMPFEKPSFPADYPRSFVSPPRRFSPQQNRRWVNDHNHVENPRRGRSPVRMPKRAFRFDSGDPAGRIKEDVYSGPRMRPGRFPPPSGTRRGCNYDDYDGKRRDDRSDFIYRPRHSGPDVTSSRFQRDSESYDCQDLDDAWNTDVPRSSRKDVISCRV